MSSNSSEESPLEADQSFLFSQQGSGLGNIICGQPSNKISTVPLLQKPDKKKSYNLSTQKETTKPKVIKKQIGLGSKSKSKKRKRVGKHKRISRKKIQFGKGASNKKSKKARLRRLYALRQSPF